MSGLRLIAVVLLAIGAVLPCFEREKGTAFVEYMRDARGGGDVVLCPVLKFGGDDLVCSPDQRSGFLAVASEAVWPLPGRVTSGFGYRRSPFHHRAVDFHEGIDIAARRGMPIRAVADGIVAFAGVERGYGRMIVIDHGFGMSSVYGHASRLFVQEGSWVARGTVIGLVGRSGDATGPHLHYEFRLARVPLDPRFLYPGGV